MPAAQWTARYEQLRQQAIEHGYGGTCWGLTLFLRRGLVAWMRAWPLTPSSEPEREEASPEELKHRVRFSSELRDEIVSVLIDMVLHKHKEVLP